MDSKKKVYTINDDNFIVKDAVKGWHQLLAPAFDIAICGILSIIFDYINTMIIKIRIDVLLMSFF